MATTLAGVRLWNGLDPTPTREKVQVRLHAGRIVGIGRDPSLAADARVVDCGGAFALPGLIDAHVHMVLDPAIRSPDAQLRVPPALASRRMASRALAMVRSGITTARDLGGGHWRELALRDRIDRGELPGPRLLCAGQPVTRPDGHCHFWRGVAADVDGIRSVVRRQVSRGVDWVKVMATGGLMTRGSAAGDVQFGPEEIAIAVEEAARAGLRVAAHCHASAGIASAVSGGVHTVEHCSWSGPGGFGSAYDSKVAREMARRGVAISATVNEGWGRRFDAEGKPSRFAQDMQRCFVAAGGEGVPLIASTDAGIPGVRHDRLAGALSAFARYADFTPVEALVSATSGSARALGLGDVTGRLEVGLSADVLLVPGDPCRDLAHLETPLLVAARGVLFGEERLAAFVRLRNGVR